MFWSFSVSSNRTSLEDPKSYGPNYFRPICYYVAARRTHLLVGRSARLPSIVFAVCFFLRALCMSNIRTCSTAPTKAVVAATKRCITKLLVSAETEVRAGSSKARCLVENSYYLDSCVLGCILRLWILMLITFPNV